MKKEDEKKKNDGKRPEKMLTRTKSVCHVLYRQAGKLSMATHNKTRLSGERIYWGRGRNHKQLPHLGFWEGPTSRARGKGWRKAKYWLLRLICDPIDLERVFCSRNAGGANLAFLASSLWILSCRDTRCLSRWTLGGHNLYARPAHRDRTEGPLALTPGIS